VYLQCLDGQFTLFVENISVLTMKSCAAAVAAFLAAFYIFNLAFPLDLLRLMTFLQDYVLSVSDSTTPKTRKSRDAQKAVIAFVSQLNVTKKRQ